MDELQSISCNLSSAFCPTRLSWRVSDFIPHKDIIYALFSWTGVGKHLSTRNRSWEVSLWRCHNGSNPSCVLRWSQELWDIFGTAATRAVSVSDPFNKSNFLCSSWVIPLQQNPWRFFGEMLFLPEAGNFKLVKALFWANKSYSRKILIKNRCTAGSPAEKESQCSLHNPWGKDMYSVWGKENECWVECDTVSLQGARERRLPQHSHCSPQTFRCKSGLTGWQSRLPSPAGSKCAAPFCHCDGSLWAINNHNGPGFKPWEPEAKAPSSPWRAWGEETCLPGGLRVPQSPLTSRNNGWGKSFWEKEAICMQFLGMEHLSSLF